MFISVYLEQRNIDGLFLWLLQLITGQKPPNFSQNVSGSKAEQGQTCRKVFFYAPFAFGLLEQPVMLPCSSRLQCDAVCR